MSQPTMILNYNETKTVTFQPKTASGAAKDPVSSSYSGVNLNLVQITPDAITPFTYAIKNITATGGGAQMAFACINELNATITDQLPITLVAADPVTQVTHVIS